MARSNKKGGWYKHPDEHALASRGIKTAFNFTSYGIHSERFIIFHGEWIRTDKIKMTPRDAMIRTDDLSPIGLYIIEENQDDVKYKNYSDSLLIINGDLWFKLLHLDGGTTPLDRTYRAWKYKPFRYKRSTANNKKYLEWWFKYESD